MGPLRDLTTKALAPKIFNDQTPMVELAREARFAVLTDTAGLLLMSGLMVRTVPS